MRFGLKLFFTCCAVMTGLDLFAQSAVTVSLDVQKPGAAIPSDFLGLSYEMHWVRPDTNGNYYFNGTDQKLANMFQTLGVKSLRVGGNSTDRPTNGMPVAEDLDHLFSFAEAAKVKVIYTFRLRGGKPEQAAETAKYIAAHHPSAVTAYAIGNEPNVFIPNYETFRERWKNYTDAVRAVDPAAQFCGPSPTLGKVGWIKDFIADFSESNHLAFVTQHFYPGGSAAKVTNAAAARTAMLSAAWPDEYAKLYGLFSPALDAKNFPYRLEEANSFWNAGAVDVSDTFASALWGLDYLYWWASHKAGGVNFHTGNQAMIGSQLVPCIYAAFWKSPEGIQARPLAYAMTAFKLTSGGRLVPATITTNADQINLTAYAVLATNRTLYITFINKENGATARAATVRLASDGNYNTCETMPLQSPENDVAAKQGVMLGGQGIEADGTWRGQWTAFPDFFSKEAMTLTVPAGSALLVKFSE